MNCIELGNYTSHVQRNIMLFKISVYFSMYTSQEVDMIKKTKFTDVLKAVTHIQDSDIQSNVFTWLDGKGL